MEGKGKCKKGHGNGEDVWGRAKKHKEEIKRMGEIEGRQIERQDEGGDGDSKW